MTGWGAQRETGGGWFALVALWGEESIGQWGACCWDGRTWLLREGGGGAP